MEIYRQPSKPFMVPGIIMLNLVVNKGNMVAFAVRRCRAQRIDFVSLLKGLIKFFIFRSKSSKMFLQRRCARI